jgi:membrane associated rhomboid family serine protease
MNMPYSPHTPAGVPTCYRHPDRQTYISCTRCGRPACPECLRSASVGHQCLDCVAAAAASVPPVRTAAGAVIRTGTPMVSYGLIAVNVVVFLLAKFAPPEQVYRLALWPVLVATGDWYQLVTSAFLHFAILHLLFNMYALYVIGPPLEEHLGRWRFAVLYGLSALGGSVMVYLFSQPNVPTVGASGAIYGLFGATFVAARRLRLDIRWLVGLIAINLVLTFAVPGISWQGHIGGLITGALIAAVFVYAPRPRRTLIQAAAGIGVLAVFAVLIGLRTAALVG